MNTSLKYHFMYIMPAYNSIKYTTEGHAAYSTVNTSGSEYIGI